MITTEKQLQDKIIKDEIAKASKSAFLKIVVDKIKKEILCIICFFLV